jgi:hypothetical protein
MDDRWLAAMELGALHQPFLRPNAKSVGRKGGIVIVGLRRIEPGEEVRFLRG